MIGIIDNSMKVHPVGNRFLEAEMAYFAGFLDADGAIMALIERHKEMKFGFRVRINLKISQKKRAILDWFVGTFQVGYIRQNRTTFDWEIRDQQVIKNLLPSLIPYLKVKRTQAEDALEILSQDILTEKDLIKVATLADTLSKNNVRSENRRKNSVVMIQGNM